MGTIVSITIIVVILATVAFAAFIRRADHAHCELMDETNEEVLFAAFIRRADHAHCELMDETNEEVLRVSGSSMSMNTMSISDSGSVKSPQRKIGKSELYHLKILSKDYKGVESGVITKLFTEDQGFVVDDVLELSEDDEESDLSVRVKVTHVLRGFEALSENHVVLSIESIQKNLHGQKNQLSVTRK